MGEAVQCAICEGSATEPLKVDSFLLPATSYAPEFHEYENYVCASCGVVFIHPFIDEARLAAHYKSAYHGTRHRLTFSGKTIDLPFNPERGPISFQRVKNFHDMITRHVGTIPDLAPRPQDLVIDYGAYEGMFLHGLSQLWGCRCLAYDHSDEGISFARRMLGFTQSCIASNILSDTFGEKARHVTLVHCLEHLRDPVGFLRHVRERVLDDHGFLYIEVPNLYGLPLCDPHHFFSYSHESLAYLLRRSGFEAIDQFATGFPPSQDFLCRNDIQHLVCLARPKATLEVPVPPGADPVAIRRRLRRLYRRHTLRGVGRQARSASREMAKLLYYVAFAIVLDRVSPTLSRRLVAALGRR